MHDAFISYATPDRATAEAACAALETAGIKVWIAPRDVYEGQPYAECIVRAVREAKVLILVFSSHSNRSQMVLRELECAASLAKPLLPVKIENITPSDEMKFFVGREHWLDAVAPSGSSHFSRLVEAVGRIVRPDAAPRGPSGTEPGRAAHATPGAPLPGQPSTGHRTLLIVGGFAIACLTIIALVVLGGLPWAKPAHPPDGGKQMIISSAKPGGEPTPTDAQGAATPAEPDPSAAAGTTLPPIDVRERAIAACGLEQVAFETAPTGSRIIASGPVLNAPELDALKARLADLDADTTAIRVEPAAVARLVSQRLKAEGFGGVIVRDYVGTNKGPQTLRIEFKQAPGKGPEEARAIARRFVRDDASFVTLVPD